MINVATIKRVIKQTTKNKNRDSKDLKVRIKKMKWDIMKMTRVKPHIELKKWNLAERGKKLGGNHEKGKVDR